MIKTYNKHPNNSEVVLIERYKHEDGDDRMYIIYRGKRLTIWYPKSEDPNTILVRTELDKWIDKTCDEKDLDGGIFYSPIGQIKDCDHIYHGLAEETYHRLYS